MKDRCCTGIVLYGFIESSKDKRIVIVIALNIWNRPSVTQIQYDAQIDLPFAFVFTGAIFEFTNVRDPFFIYLVRMKFPVQYVFCYVCRIRSRFCTTVVPVFYDGADLLFPAYTS